MAELLRFAKYLKKFTDVQQFAFLVSIQKGPNRTLCFFLPKLFVKFWGPLFLALKFTFLFLNLAIFKFLFLKVPMGGRGGTPVQELFLKKQFIFTASLSLYDS